MKHRLFLAALSAAVLLTLSACVTTDVVARYASSSFEALIQSMPDKVQAQEAGNGWALTSPTGERFVWSSDASFSVAYVMLEINAKPFIDAGLDTAKLPEPWTVEEGSKLQFKASLGQDDFTTTENAAPLTAFNAIINANKEILGYHHAMDHFGIALGQGNMFEWAKDLKANDKDMVFVLNPQPFLDAGVDPTMVEGWVFDQVEIMEDNGRTLKVDKFLKPFNIE